MAKKIREKRDSHEGPVEVAAPPLTKIQLTVRLIRLKERGKVLQEMIQVCQESIQSVELGIKKTNRELEAFKDPRVVTRRAPLD